MYVDERKVLLARMTVFTPRDMGCIFLRLVDARLASLGIRIYCQLRYPAKAVSVNVMSLSQCLSTHKIPMYHTLSLSISEPVHLLNSTLRKKGTADLVGQAGSVQ